MNSTHESLFESARGLFGSPFVVEITHEACFSMSEKERSSCRAGVEKELS
jgi:hypothetical protein